MGAPTNSGAWGPPTAKSGPVEDPAVGDVDCFGDNSDSIKSSTDEGGSNIEYQVP